MRNDLFRWRLLHNLYRNCWFPLSAQVVTFGVFTLLIAGSICESTVDAEFAMILRNTNLSNLIVWSYWWPAIIVSAILIGRHWCTICPIELITSLFSKIGLKRKPNHFLGSGWGITIFYGLILVFGIHTFAIHRVPQRMAIYMLLLLGVSIVFGLIWEKRSFCTHACPIGHLLGLYSMLSAMEWRVRDQDVCKKCRTKECIASDRHYSVTAKSCTSDLYPAKISDNRKCLVCSQCLSVCLSP